MFNNQTPNSIITKIYISSTWFSIHHISQCNLCNKNPTKINSGINSIYPIFSSRSNSSVCDTKLYVKFTSEYKNIINIGNNYITITINNSNMRYNIKINMEVTYKPPQLQKSQTKTYIIPIFILLTKLSATWPLTSSRTKENTAIAIVLAWYKCLHNAYISQFCYCHLLPIPLLQRGITSLQRILLTQIH
jgi:hypothetical protein